MPKKPTGYTPDKAKSSPLAKQSVPFKTPALKGNNLPQPIKGGLNNVANIPKQYKLPKV